jgi:hypothetical protein
MRFATRHPQWEARLAEALAAWQGRPYRFAPGQDCIGFVLAAIEAVTGERLVFELKPYRSPAGQARALRAAGWASLPAAADDCLGGRIAPLQAMCGDVVSDGSVLGIMTRAGPQAFGEGGMVRMAPASITAAWPVGRADG